MQAGGSSPESGRRSGPNRAGGSGGDRRPRLPSILLSTQISVVVFVHPLQGAGDRLLPLPVAALPALGVRAGEAIRPPCASWRAGSRRSGQKPTASPAAYAAPRETVSATIGRTTGTPTKSASSCISRLSAVIPPSALSTRRSVAGVDVHRLQHLAGLPGGRLQHRAGQVPLGGVAGEPGDDPPRVRAPVGSEEARRRRAPRRPLRCRPRSGPGSRSPRRSRSGPACRGATAPAPR